VIAPTPPDHGSICLAQCAVAHQLTPIGRWIEQRSDLVFGQLLSAHHSYPLHVETGRPADPGPGVYERAEAAANRGLAGAAASASITHSPAPKRSRYVRLCYKNGLFVSSGHTVQPSPPNHRSVQQGPGKTLDTFDFEAVPVVSKAQVMALAAGDAWLNNGANLLLFYSFTALSMRVGQP
jgi:hypothetical protein